MPAWENMRRTYGRTNVRKGSMKRMRGNRRNTGGSADKRGGILPWERL
ncbi:hypothetical protein HMPREF1985_01832 [Mitsuokella sp. oral taxon 131 str. W9106]|nr:hypothetical protein HMPREF1985_01832 [Mitsuokella sp. oral taxon 131 str. W9106]